MRKNLFALSGLVCVVLWLTLSIVGCPGPPGLPDSGVDGSVESGGNTEQNSGDSAERSSSEITTEAAPEEPVGQDVTPEAGSEPQPELSLEQKPDFSEPSQPEPTPEKVVEVVSENTLEPVTEPNPEVKPESVPEVGTDTPPASGIGAPCTQDSDCGASPYRCVKETGSPSFPFPSPTGKGPPGGYCTQSCFVGSNSCPTGSECYVPGAASGACLKICKSASDCRQKEGYLCTQDGGSTNKMCFPPNCQKQTPSGTYNVILGPASKRGTCTNPPLASGTSVGVTVTVTGTVIKFQFFSKPGSPLPVTWTLEGSYPGLKNPLTAANKTGCTANCDGLLKGSFTNACLFWGTLDMQTGTGCWYTYDVQIPTR